MSFFVLYPEQEFETTRLLGFVVGSAILIAAGVLDDPAPSVRARDFGSGTYELELRWWHGPRLSEESQAQDQVVRSVKRQLDAAGIAMPSPERIVRQPDLPDGSTPA